MSLYTVSYLGQDQWLAYEDTQVYVSVPNLRDTNKRAGKLAMFTCLKRIRPGLPKGLEELAQFGRSLWRRRREILVYFDVGVSNGPVEAINGRLEHLRGIALRSAISPTTSCGR